MIPGCNRGIEPITPDVDVDGSDLAEFVAVVAVEAYDADDLESFAGEFGTGTCF